MKRIDELKSQNMKKIQELAKARYLASAKELETREGKIELIIRKVNEERVEESKCNKKKWYILCNIKQYSTYPSVKYSQP